jgi:hypothetical protein
MADIFYCWRESMGRQYKKLAGTSAVFILDSYQGASPVDREGLVWTEEELHLEQMPRQQRPLTAMANGLALEGLEEYDPPNNGDVRKVNSLDAAFVYMDNIRAWVQIDNNELAS